LEVCTVQFGITFGKHAEIHLNDRKYQKCAKIVENPPQQHICRPLLVKKKFRSMNDIFSKIVSQSICVKNKMTNKHQQKSSKNAMSS
jgi:hypothetical protein